MTQFLETRTCGASVFLLLTLALFGPAGCVQATDDAEPVWPINTVVGDISFVETFGDLPDAHTDQGLRIETHLHYIEERLRCGVCSTSTGSTAITNPANTPSTTTTPTTDAPRSWTTRASSAP
jgi:hypothetical protein